MKKAIIAICLFGTGLILNSQPRHFSHNGNSQHQHFSYDDSFTRHYIHQHYGPSYEVRLFTISWNHLINAYLATTYFSNRLSSISSFDLPTEDPEKLLSEYYEKINQLNADFAQQQEVNNVMIDQGVRGMGELAADFARDNNITTKDPFADFLIKEIAIGTIQERAKQKNAEKMELQRSELQRNLESNLSYQMSAIRDQMLSENSEFRDKYLEAMAYEGDYSKESYYASCYDYYDCFVEQIKTEYIYYSTSWYKPNCITPKIEYSTTINTRDYTDIAFRKLGFYRKYNNEIFLNAVNIFLDAGLAENRQNPKAYYLKAQLESDIIDKMFFASLAVTLDPENNEYGRQLSEITNSFNEDFFTAIRNGNVDFISRSIERGFHLGRERNGRTAIEAAIDFDKAGILEMLINSIPGEKNTLSENSKSLLFHACAVDALEVIKKLISMGVNPEFADKNYSGLTALNIAVENNSPKAIGFLASNFAIKPAMLFAKKINSENLDNISSCIYSAVPTKLGEISSINTQFRTTFFSNILMQTNYTDCEIYMNSKKVGYGKAEISNNFIDEKYHIKIIKNGFSTEEKDLELRPGTDLVVNIKLQMAPKPIIKNYTLKDIGYEERDLSFYYREPVGLKKETRKNKEFNQSLRDKATNEAQESLRLYNEEISRELEKRNNIVNEKNRKILEDNNRLESERLVTFQYLDKEITRKVDDHYTSSDKVDNPEPNTSENSNQPETTKIANFETQSESDKLDFNSNNKLISNDSDNESTFKSAYGFFTDSRDGQQYGWVKINNQIWMSENLAFIPSDDGFAWIYDTEPGDREVIYNSAVFKEYGVLYTYKTAIRSCPAGWRVPSDLEWSRLENFLDNTVIDFNQIAYRGTTIGSKLIMTRPGSLKAKFGGKRMPNGIYIGMEKIGSYWTSTRTEDLKVWNRQIQKNLPQIIRGKANAEEGNSVRCVKDEQVLTTINSN